LGIVEAETEHIAAIVRRVRDFYRPARKEMQPTDVHTVLNSVLELSGKQMQNNDVTVEREWTDGLPWVQANPDHLKQVFLNLVLNAVDAMARRGGTLCVRTSMDQIHRTDGPSQPAVRIEFATRE
jgi:two-component system NtrC family sensor kinase